MSPVPRRNEQIASDLRETNMSLSHWKLMLRQADSVRRRIECRNEIGRCTQRIHNLRRELQEGY
jgi:hypothetical protein